MQLITIQQRQYSFAVTCFLTAALAFVAMAGTSWGQVPDSAVSVGDTDPGNAGLETPQTPAADPSGESAPAADDSVTPAADPTPTDSTTPSGDPSSKPPSTPSVTTEEESEVVIPWDYDPYRILIWVVSDDPEINADVVQADVLSFINREYSAAWRTTIADAPNSVASSAMRSLGELDFINITAADPVIALKRDHKDAVRIRAISNVFQYVENVYGTKRLIQQVKERGAAAGDENIGGAAQTLKAVDGDTLAVRDMWADEKTEAILVSRGIADSLTEPEAKLVELPIANLVMTDVDAYDKIFIAHVQRDQVPNQVSVVEFNTLMRYTGAVLSEPFVGAGQAPEAIARAVMQAFTPEVRIDDAGLKEAKGLVRAGGLFTSIDSPGLVRNGDVLLPMVRKNDRNGRPIMIGPLDWAFLLAVAAKPQAVDDGFKLTGESVTIPVLANDEDPSGRELKVTKIYGRIVEPGDFVDVPKGRATLNDDYSITFTPKDEDYEPPTEFAYDISNGELTSRAKITDNPAVSITREKDPSEKEEKPAPELARVTMEFYSGRTGGLQGRQNKRTFRRALRIRPRLDETMVRLHAKGNAEFPLIGYELYEKELYSKKMTFIGRTDWNGRLNIPKNDDPLRLLYVKNGGAVLARLPLVPGFTPREIADLTGDDMRLQAEAYVSGVANMIVDLVAIRKLLGARIRGRLKRGQIKEAKELLDALREQPTKEILSGDMDRKQAFFLQQIPTRSYNARSKVDSMFKTTREMLDKQITPKYIREIEEYFIRAESNGGKLPDDPKDEDEVDSSVNQVPTAEEKK